MARRQLRTYKADVPLSVPWWVSLIFISIVLWGMAYVAVLFV